MYLISLYFDEKTDKRIRNDMKRVADASGNTCMLEGNVPPHITLAAFETKAEKDAKTVFRRCVENMEKGQIQWVSVAVFLPYVMYLTPVLNEYLQKMSEICDSEIQKLPDAKMQKHYRPYNWMPHTTIGKKMTSEEMERAFHEMIKYFTPFSGNAIKIGLAKTNPYEDLEIHVFI